MVTITSAEIRWFIKGKIPPTIFDWFIGLNDNYINQAERIDYYLLLQSDDSLGIKLREGRVEIKQRTNQIGNITPGENVAGIAEKWRKWSFELNEANQILSDELIKNEWCSVSKTRILVNYGISQDNIVAQKEEVIYKNGCLTEITSLKINNENWWTFGLEAYGEENRLLDNLVLISHLILNDKSTIQLTLHDSLSYPGWLKRMNDPLNTK
ncbi:MAG: hypothetical protein IMY70_04225 [Bacteroidetes bacterium]|nr:hypothetical protein [Bacteroidota bacterium]